MAVPAAPRGRNDAREGCGPVRGRGDQHEDMLCQSTASKGIPTDFVYILSAVINYFYACGQQTAQESFN